jgi:hypothetical protein
MPIRVTASIFLQRSERPACATLSKRLGGLPRRLLFRSLVPSADFASDIQALGEGCAVLDKAETRLRL